ncbi:MAG: glycosyltransferase [Phycisphaerae bacterium]|nr:glycosyltransferase [Phycisphaerae bacterium]
MKVSAVIPVYNNARFIARTLESVLAQSRPADEIIVVDDGSTDNSAEVIKGFGQKVRYIYQENAGASAARNTGIHAAKYEWIALLDGDDEWLEDYLKRQVELLEANPQLVWSTGNYFTCLCDENRRSSKFLPEKCQAIMKDKQYHKSYFKAFVAEVHGWTGTMIIKKEVLVKAGLFRSGQLKANDIDMWFRIAYRWKQIGCLAEPLAIYHLCIPQSISRKYGPKRAEIHWALIERLLGQAQELDALTDFQPCATHMLRCWNRSALFQKSRYDEIRHTLKRFGDLFSWRYKVTMRLLTLSPAMTAGGCHLISYVIRKLDLRRQVVRKPQR